VRADAVKDHGITPNTIDQQEIRAKMTLRHTGPIGAALVEAMFPDASGRVPPEIMTSKTYSRVSDSNSGCFRAER
jgi:hypothetical protein